MDQNYGAYGEANGVIIIDAADAALNEPYAHVSPGNGDFNWKITRIYHDPAMNAVHKNIQIVPADEKNSRSSRVWDVHELSASPCMNFKVYAEDTGEYYISFHSASPDAASDSFYIGINHELQFASSDAMSGGSDDCHAAVGAAWFYCDKLSVHLNQGMNLLNIWGRESGVCLRQLMLSREKPMPAKYLYFESQKTAEWLPKSRLVTGHIAFNVPDDITMSYGGRRTVKIEACASNGSHVEVDMISSMDTVSVQKNNETEFLLIARKGGSSTITITAAAENCAAVKKTFFVNISYRIEGIFSKNAPQNLRVAPATETCDSITIVWNKPRKYSEITGYRVYINGRSVSEREARKTYYEACHLKGDTEYSFCVEAVHTDGSAFKSPTLYARTRSDEKVIDVTCPPYHAIGDGITLDTKAIQAAIDDCPYGGTVLIPEGSVFLSGALDLKSHMTLKVEGELKGSENPSDYLLPAYEWSDNGIGERIMSRFEGWELLCLRSLINVGRLNWRNRGEVTCEDVTIRGNGKISGGGTALQTASINMAKEYGWKVGSTNEYLRSRGFLINITQCRNVNLTGVHISDSPCWTVHMIYSDTVTTHGVEIVSNIINGDGWDPDSSKNLMLFDSVIVTGDDCVAIKSGKNPEGDQVNIPTENIEIFDLNCTGGHGLAIGSEISGGINNIFIHDCKVRNTLYGLQLKGTEKRGGGITNLKIQDCLFNLLLIKSNVGYNADGDAAKDAPLFNNLTIRNVTVEKRIEIAGFNKTDCHNHYVNNVLFEDIVIGTDNDSPASIALEYCDKIAFHNVRSFSGKTPDFIMTGKNHNISLDGRSVC